MDIEATENPPAHAGNGQTVRARGGWITFPFLSGTVLGLGLAASGATSNLIIYLIKEYNIKNVDGAQINNIISGCTNLAPVAGALVADALFDCFPVIAFSAIISFLSLVLFTLTATIRSLRPTPCTSDAGTCEQASALQLAVLYLAVALLSVGMGGSRFNMVALGAAQFDKNEDRDVFFNWYFVILYVSALLGYTVIVYVQDTLSWGLGFGICAAANAVSVGLLITGMPYFRRPKAKGSPFTSLARVPVASIRKRKAEMTKKGIEYYSGTGVKSQSPTKSFRFFNRAALIADGDTGADGSVADPWSLCTVEEVEDLKSLLRIVPLWTSNIALSVCIGVQTSLSVLQALTMDRGIARHFTLPASSIIVMSLVAVAISLPILDRIIIPTFHRLTNRTSTPLQRIGVGHVFNALAMVASALVERRRAAIVHAHHAEAQLQWTVPMSVLWLALPFALAGLGEALHFPAQVSLYLGEFPESFRSTAAGVVALVIATGWYGSTAVIALVRRQTDWLHDNLNGSRLDKVYWMLAAVATVNFGYFVTCAMLYRYKKREDAETATEGEVEIFP